MFIVLLPDFYNYDGTKYIGNKVQDAENCMTTSVTWIFENGGRRQACSRQLLFEDNFDTINSTNWNLIQRFAGAPVRINYNQLFIEKYGEPVL